MNARTGGSTSPALPVGWSPVDAPPTGDHTGDLPVVVSLRVRGVDGRPAWLWTVTGDVGNSARRRLRTEQPRLDTTLRAAMDERGGAMLLPWIEYGDPKASGPYLVCDRPGPTLADDLARGPLPVAGVVSVALHCVEALRVLHRLGRAHGMVAPQTLHHDGGRIRLSSPLPPALAELVALAGGTGHEPPEVLRGSEPDAAADVFALASTSWMLLSGRPPFGSADDQLARLTAAAPPPLRRREVSSAMESALRAALSPEPSRRPDLLTLAQALRIVHAGAAPVSAVAPAVAPSKTARRVSAHDDHVQPPARPVDPERQDTQAPTRPVTVEQSGTPLGSRYLLDALIGRGATGHVWRGHTRDNGRPVAVKLLRSELAEDPEVVTRFMRERTALTNLVHPNLVAVRDLVAEGSALAIVMDLVEGKDLRTVLGGGPLPLADTARLVSQTCAALAAVHAAGFVHRDLKPENVLIEPDGDTTRARLTDFGLSRGVGPSTLTRATQLVGTPAYVAPEVVAGRAPGPPVDVYAVGVTAYEALAGRRPFQAESTAGLLRAHLDEPPPRPDGVSDAVWELIELCLRKQPHERPTADTLATAWGRVAAGDDPGVVAAPPMFQPLPEPAAVPPADQLLGPPPPYANEATGPTGPQAAPVGGSMPIETPLRTSAPNAGPPAPPDLDPQLRSTTSGRQLTTAAARPLAPKHSDPEPERRSRKRLWWALAAVIVLGFGGGFAAFALTHDDKPKAAAEIPPYPLPAKIVTVKNGKIQYPQVEWTVPAGLVKDNTQFLVQPANPQAKAALARQGFQSGDAHALALPDLPVRACVYVYAYNVRKRPPSGARPQACRGPTPSASTSSSTSAAKPSARSSASTAPASRSGTASSSRAAPPKARPTKAAPTKARSTAK